MSIGRQRQERVDDGGGATSTGASDRTNGPRAVETDGEGHRCDAAGGRALDRHHPRWVRVTAFVVPIAGLLVAIAQLVAELAG